MGEYQCNKYSKKMNANSVITLTFGDQAENHAGMETLGHLSEPGQGFNYQDLLSAKEKLEQDGFTSQLIQLELYDSIDNINHEIDIPEEAYVLIIKDGVNKLLEPFQQDHKSMFNEQSNLELDKKAWMRGRVVNKHARWNLCFDTQRREPNYEKKQGRIVSYDDIPITKLLVEQFEKYFGPKATNLKGEGNYYYDTSKCGIGFHGDSERRKVIAVRLGASMSLHYQWFVNSEPVGERIIIPLNGGDMYVMSEKAVGTDWKKKKIYTLRHATGAGPYIKL